MNQIRFFIVMGVSGSGKTVVGKALAQTLGWDFFDADDFHPPANVAKMASGIPLDDSDRAPWLDALHELISSSLTANRPAVLACSALKERYRQRLLEGNDDVQIVYLKGGYDLIWSRMETRTDHYMKPSMLQSQFDALEEPVSALTVDIALSVDEIVGEIASLSKGVLMTYQIGILGLGVMGRSLALNLHRNGWRVIGYDTAPNLPADFPVAVADSIHQLTSALETPRLILLMVPAGDSVDEKTFSGGNLLRRDGRLGRGERRASRAESHAWGERVRLGSSPKRARVHRRENIRRRVLRRMDGTRRRGALCQDGSQRHRICRHAVDRRDV